MMYNFKLGSTLNSLILLLSFLVNQTLPTSLGSVGFLKKNVLLLAIRKCGFALHSLRISKLEYENRYMNRAKLESM